MRLATFNVENFFERAAALNQPREKAKPVLNDYSQLMDLISNETYSPADKAKMKQIMGGYKGLLTNGASSFIVLEEVRGNLVKKGDIVANGRADWVGWFDLVKEPVNEVAVENTARVIKEIETDVLCVVEAESRTALVKFNEMVIGNIWGQKFGHVMLIDGNDTRGIDVGILLRDSFPIQSIVSHVDDTDAEGQIFSRDCAEYLIQTPDKNKLLVMVNHLKSKGYGGYASSAAKRKRQAKRVREIYDTRILEGYDYIAIAGDFNDTPDSDALTPLLQGSGLVDVMSHANFSGDGRPGTYANGTKPEKIDYILMSPKLADKVTNGSITRKGVWGGKNGTLFPHFDEITKPIEAASDHAALWVDLSI